MYSTIGYNYENQMASSAMPSLEIENCLEPTKKGKRFRSSFTMKQLMTLEKEFNKAPYLCRVRRSELAQELELTDRQVKVWFQNKRMKSKREQTLAEAEKDMSSVSSLSPTSVEILCNSPDAVTSTTTEMPSQIKLEKEEFPLPQSQYGIKPYENSYEKSYDNSYANSYENYNYNQNTLNGLNNIKKEEHICNYYNSEQHVGPSVMCSSINQDARIELNYNNYSNYNYSHNYNSEYYNGYNNYGFSEIVNNSYSDLSHQALPDDLKWISPFLSSN